MLPIVCLGVGAFLVGEKLAGTGSAKRTLPLELWRSPEGPHVIVPSGTPTGDPDRQSIDLEIEGDLFPKRLESIRLRICHSDAEGRMIRWGTAERNPLMTDAWIEDGAGTVLFRLGSDWRSDLTRRGSFVGCRFDATGAPVGPGKRIRLLIEPARQDVIFGLQGVQERRRPATPLPGLRAVHSRPFIPDVEPVYIVGQTIAPGSAPPLSRLELLARMWGGTIGKRTILGMLGVAFLALLVGIALPLKTRGFRRSGVMSVLRAAALVVGFALPYVIVIPPFHGADENRNFAALLRVMGMEERVESVEALGDVGHFGRLRSRSYEHFGSDAARQPLDPVWRDKVGHGYDADIQSGVVWPIWRLAAWAGSLEAGPALLRIRLINVLLNALLIGFGIGMLRFVARVEVSGFHPAAVLAVVPALPFFMAPCSNYSLAVGGAVLIGMAVALPLLSRDSDMRVTSRPGGTFGVELAMAVILATGVLISITSSRAGLPMLAYPLFLFLITRLISVQSRHRSRRAARNEAAAVWAAFLLILTVLGFLPMGGFEGQLGKDLEAAARLVGVEYHAGAILVELFVLIGFPAFVDVTRVELRWIRRGRTYGPEDRRAPPIGPRQWFGMVILSGAWLTPLFLAPPGLHALARNLQTPPLVDYLREVLLTFACSFGPGAKDSAFAISYWWGFGWLDGNPPWGLVWSVATGFWVGWMALMWRLRGWKWVYLLTFFVTSLAILIALALGSVMTGAFLHGRYLIPFYVPLCIVAWLGFTGLQPRCGPVVRAVTLITAIAVQTVSLRWMLDRYFG
ncbi:MAG: hypothetical protein H7A46_23020 [Verrucomicrobiales bacterium]|nr:hypothetical protein [Verrucomicrobiales bacterium]